MSARRVQINMSHPDATVLMDLVTNAEKTYRETNDMNDPVKLEEWAKLDKITADIAIAIMYAENQ